MSEGNGATLQQRAVEYVEIELDRPRRLLLNHNAVALAERELRRITGDWVPFPQLMARLRLCGISEMIVVLWAALIHEDSQLTQEQCASIMETQPLSYITEKLVESMKQHFPVSEEAEQEAQEDSEKDPPRAAREPTG